MIIDLLIDFWILLSSENNCRIWSDWWKKSCVVFFAVVPNAIMYFLLLWHRNGIFIPGLQFNMSVAQVVSIVCAILFTLFETPDNNIEPLSNLYLPKKFIETHTVSVLIWSFLGQISGLLSTNYPASVALAGLSMGFYGCGKYFSFISF